MKHAAGKAMVLLLMIGAARVVASAQAAVPSGAGQKADAAGDPPRHVVRVYGQPMVYVKHGENNFVYQDPQPKGLQLVGARVEKSLKSGYVLLMLPDGAVWVDRMNLQFDGEVPQAYCSRLATSSRTAVSQGVRGVSEGCP